MSENDYREDVWFKCPLCKEDASILVVAGNTISTVQIITRPDSSQKHLVCETCKKKVEVIREEAEHGIQNRIEKLFSKRSGDTVRGTSEGKTVLMKAIIMIETWEDFKKEKKIWTGKYQNLPDDYCQSIDEADEKKSFEELVILVKEIGATDFEIEILGNISLIDCHIEMALDFRCRAL